MPQERAGQTDEEKTKPIIVDRYVPGMGISLAMNNIIAIAGIHEKGGAVYVDDNVRERVKAILTRMGFTVAPDEE